MPERERHLRRDQVRERGLAGPARRREMALVGISGARNTKRLVGPRHGRASVSAEHRHGARAPEGKHAVVLEQHDGLGADLADELGVVAAHVAVLGGVGLGGDLAVVQAREVERQDDAHGHVVEARLRHAAIGYPGLDDGFCPVCARAEVEPGVGAAVRGRLRLHVRENITGKAQVRLEVAAEDGVVLAAARAVGAVHGAHDGGHARAHAVGKGPEVDLLRRLLVHVGRVALARHAVRLLLVEEEVAAGRDHACRVHTRHGLAHRYPAQVRVEGEALCVAPAFGDASCGACYGAVDEAVAHL